MADMSVELNRRYFITSLSSTIEGTPIYRERWSTRWRTFHGLIRSEEISISILSVSERGYESSSKIDPHNRSPQDDLTTEKKFEVKDGSSCENISSLSI